MTGLGRGNAQRHKAQAPHTMRADISPGGSRAQMCSLLARDLRTRHPDDTILAPSETSRCQANAQVCAPLRQPYKFPNMILAYFSGRTLACVPILYPSCGSWVPRSCTYQARRYTPAYICPFRLQYPAQIPNIHLNQLRPSISYEVFSCQLGGYMGASPTSKHMIKVRRRSTNMVLGRNGFDTTLP